MRRSYERVEQYSANLRSEPNIFVRVVFMLLPNWDSELKPGEIFNSCRNRIDLIKAFRFITGLGLKESKDAIEAHLNEIGHEQHHFSVTVIMPTEKFKDYLLAYAMESHYRIPYGGLPNLPICIDSAEFVRAVETTHTGVYDIT